MMSTQNYELPSVAGHRTTQPPVSHALERLSKPHADHVNSNSKTTNAIVLNHDEPLFAIEFESSLKNSLQTHQPLDSDNELVAHLDNSPSGRTSIPAYPSVQLPTFTTHWIGTETSGFDVLARMYSQSLAGGHIDVGGRANLVSKVPDNHTPSRGVFFSDESDEDYFDEVEEYTPPDVSAGSVRQYIPINADNDRHAPVTPYQTGTPVTSYGKFYPDNYAYDFKYVAPTPDENDVLQLTKEQDGATPIPMMPKKIEWKLVYSAPADSVSRVRFWGTGKKENELTPSDNWQFTPLPPSMPDPMTEGMVPGPYVEGIEPSKAIDDAGSATLSVRYTLMDNSLVVINYKPVVLTITPVLDKFVSLPAHTKKAYVWESIKNPGSYYFAARAVMEANFAAIDSVGVIKAVQFVDQKTNDTDNLQNGFTLTFDPTKPGYNQNIHRDSKYKIDNNAVAGKPQMALPFIDVENTVDIPFYKWNQFRVNQATKAGDYIFFDGPGVSNISIIIKEYDCKLEFTTYLVLSYADPVNPLYNTTYPLAKLNWDVTIHGTNFVAVQGGGFTVDNTGSSMPNIGPSTIVHEYDAKYKLTQAISMIGMPLSP